jgi:hypothetical protein
VFVKNKNKTDKQETHLIMLDAGHKLHNALGRLALLMAVAVTAHGVMNHLSYDAANNKTAVGELAEHDAVFYGADLPLFVVTLLVLLYALYQRFKFREDPQYADTYKHMGGDVSFNKAFMFTALVYVLLWVYYGVIFIGRKDSWFSAETDKDIGSFAIVIGAVFVILMLSPVLHCPTMAIHHYLD